VPSSFEISKISKIRKSLRSIFERKNLEVSENELYQDVRALCFENFSEKLFEFVKNDSAQLIEQTIASTCSNNATCLAGIC